MKLADLSISERYCADLHRLHIWMCVSNPNEICVSDYDDVARIRNVLDQQDIGYSRCSDYVRSICSMMNKLGIVHDEYCKLLREYDIKGRRLSEKDIKVDTSTLIRVASGDLPTEPGIRLMCIVLLSGMDLSMKNVHDYLRGTVKVENVWKVNGHEYVLTDQMREVFTALEKDSCKLSYREFSCRFKSVVGNTYSTLYRSLKVQTVLNVKKHVSVKPDNDMRALLSKNIHAIHLDNLSHLWQRIYEEEKIDYYRYDTMECYERVKSLTDLSRNTKINYITAICILLEEIAGRMYNEYKMYQLELQLDEYKTNLCRHVPCFVALYQDIKRVYETSTNKSLRVLCLVVLSNVNDVNGQLSVSEHELGVIRPSDMINTRYIDDGKHSYLDLQTNKWLIRKGQTKNKTERLLSVSETLSKGIQEIYDNKLPEYMIVAKNGKKYSGSMSDVIKEHIGCTFDEIRSSYFSWRECTVTDRSILLQLCYRQGHKFSTAMMNYKRNYSM
jgi:hypothetical protein